MASEDEKAACGVSEEDAEREDGDLIGLMESRARMYGMLSRMFLKEIDEEALRDLQGMKFPTATGNERVDEGYSLLYKYLSRAWEESVTELAIDYVRTFIGHGVNGFSAAYPFESVYTSERRLMMQEARAEVLQTLRDNGLKRGRWTEGEDHIALELEFMQRMALRCADDLRAGDEDAAVEHVETQRTFVRDHLLNWLPMFTSDMLKFSRTDFYQGLAHLSLGYVDQDAALLDDLLDEGDGEA
jgi:putative dimethyl sulfoxide reductase chaperone